jgi:adhesin HecA-like repeat protein
VHLSAGSLDNTSGQVIAQTDLDLDVMQLRNAGGQLYAHQALRSNRTGTTLDNRGGQIGAGERIELTASSLDNGGGRIVAQDVFLQLDRLAIADGQIAGNHTLQANLSQLSGLGRLYGGVSNTIHFSGDYTHLVEQMFDTAGELALTVAGLLLNQGTLDAYGALRIQASALNNQGLLNSANP